MGALSVLLAIVLAQMGPHRAALLPPPPGTYRTLNIIYTGRISLRFIVRVASPVPTRLFWGETGAGVAQESILLTSQAGAGAPPCTHTFMPAVHTLSAAVKNRMCLFTCLTYVYIMYVKNNLVLISIASSVHGVGVM
jgi:hypothetical protein